ncbi:MAG: efflux RND transporter periplasmic adaptor subunit [Limisphaerales bacterium]
MNEAPITKFSGPLPRLKPWAIGIFILFAVGFVLGMLPRWRHTNELRAETQELAVPTVIVAKPVPGKAEAGLNLPAEVKARMESPIYARASGYLTKWKVDLGASVKSGDLLAEIDAPELDQEIEASHAGLEQANAALALAKVTAERWSELLKTASVSEQENAEKAADLKLKKANVDAASANLHRLEDLKSFTRIMAPFDGIITARDIDVGDLITPGKELFRLADTRTLRIYVRVPQSATRGIAVGTTADMIVPEMPQRKFPVKVVRTAGAIDVSSRTLLTEMEIDNTAGELVAGSFAQVTFNDAAKDPALVVPSNCLLFRAEGPEVGIVAADGHVTLHPVIIGRDFGKTLEILSGVQTGDQVIINPGDSLVTGTLVRVATAKQ